MTRPGNAPGWYPDPGGGLNLRWYDGIRWTDNYAPGSVQNPATPPTSKWFGPEWEAAMVKSAHRSVKHLIFGLVLFVLVILFIIVAAVANNFDQVKAMFGM